MKTDGRTGGILGVPGGEVTSLNPDGVSKTENGHSMNSLMNANWVHGGPNGCGYGAFGGDNDITPLFRESNPNRLKVR